MFAHTTNHESHQDFLQATAQMQAVKKEKEKASLPRQHVNDRYLVRERLQKICNRFFGEKMLPPH